MIQLKNLGFRYSGAERLALDGIDLTVEDGAFLGLIGSSGAGKSTLCYALSGIVPHHYRGDFYGEARIEGMDSAEHRPEELSRVLGCVFQDIDGQMVASVVEDEILFGLENFGVPRDEIEGRVTQALAAAGISELRGRLISELSGGQRQKVAIAAITALRPKIIVLDEPTGELDPRSSRRVFETLKELNEKHGVTIIVVEQKIMLLCEFAKRLAVMEEGRLILEGEVPAVLQSAGRLEAAGVNIPRVTTLARALREEGLYGGKLPLNLDEGEAMMREVLRPC
ncbi:MAG: energy-coupling factor ABC transporter ATP-binding protein [Christensenellaceae bacterium]|jgi:energy-coupling factor transport system ATP-binding protein|nr:energy-coupling factor ABC transporter ATP-binding protein [Christensenellaceae bacterium]